MEQKLMRLESEYMTLFNNQTGIFPLYWFEMDDLDKKLSVLELAIKEKKRIVDVKGGGFFVEGIE